ncbi:MAG: Rrf2 family transcriptional regulator [Gammaproteobacteria bacterium]|jgi:Rrf2 family iron-sulfur cluster assembly transcriptional regulator|nr:Rrf2 family transcriptional regulator [Gammaproteobacteria bacterium]
MKLSTKGRHAVTAMMELALQHKQGPVTLADISAQQSISISYLEQLFARLRQHGLVTGMRGPGGGYCLARPAGEITIANILATVDDVSRREEQPHTQSEIPAGGQMWMRLSNRIYDYLDSITLEEAVASFSDEAKESKFGSGFQQTAA